jgi:predicted alpha/beta-hydrolase family hydrolase
VPAAAPVEFTIEIPSAKGAVTARHFTSGTPGAPLLVLAHGAGADQRHRFMVDMARRLVTRHVEVVTFNFLYTEQRRRTPDRAPVLEDTWRSVLDAVVERLKPRGRVAVGGKSMGGRIASQVLALHPSTPGWQKVTGLVLLGYPLHPPGQADRLRSAHLPQIGVPILLAQGTRDAFGTKAEVEPIFSALPVQVIFEFVEGGDHSFAVPKSSGRSDGDVLDAVADRVADWFHSLPTSD